MGSLTVQRDVVNTSLITFILQHFVETYLDNVHHLELGLLEEGGHAFHGPHRLGIVIPNIASMSQLGGQVGLIVQPHLLETEDVRLEDVELRHDGLVPLERGPAGVRGVLVPGWLHVAVRQDVVGHHAEAGVQARTAHL